jgi:prephenate dehydratase
MAKSADAGGQGLRLAALGGPHTFNAQAAQAMCERYPQFTEIVYLPTSDQVVRAALRGEVDAACAPEQSSVTGFHDGMLARMTGPGAKLCVIAEAARCYDCSLLGKPGAALAQVARVFGHDGSITHSRPWLEQNLPNAAITIVDTHSEVAAQTVLASDGGTASVGSPGLASKFGLVELAKKIDAGSAVNYWALSLQQLFPDAPTRLLVTGRFGDDEQLSGLISALAEVGYLIRTVCPRPSGRALNECDYMLRFAGIGSLVAVRAAVAGFRSARLAGAWEARDEVMST